MVANLSVFVYGWLILSSVFCYDKVCGERYRNNTSYSAHDSHTPFVAEGALLAFRNHLLLHYTIREPVIQAIKGDYDRVPLGVFFGGGGGGNSDCSMTAADQSAAVVWPHEVVFTADELV